MAKSKQITYLSLLILIPVFNLLNNCVVINGSLVSYPWLLVLSSSTSGLFCIFLKAHINHILNKKVTFRSVTDIACYVAILSPSIIAINFSFQPEQEVLKFLQGMVDNKPPFEFQVYNTVFYTSQLISFIDIAIVVFKKGDKKNLNLFNIERESIRYSRRLLIFIIIVYSLCVLPYIFGMEYLAEYLFLPLGMNLLYMYILFNHRKFMINFWSVPDEIDDENDSRDLNNRSVDPATMKALNTFFIEKKPYLEMDFNQRKLEEQTNIPIHQISFAINTEYNMNFSDFVSAFRIDHSKTLLEKYDPKKDTIENIAYDSGFNSKASFYRAFKRHTSSTPKKFVASI
jgi:AraC-like DNA-binding protein